MFKNKLVSISSIVVFVMLFSSIAIADKVGEVSTTFKMIGANDKIVIEVFDDPSVTGVSCYLSRAKTGGVSGTIGIAEDTSDASISCRQVAAIKIGRGVTDKPQEPTTVFKQSTSIMFKTIQVVRFYDNKRKVLIYLAYSDKLIEGSPKNSISIVPIGDGGRFETSFAGL